MNGDGPTFRLEIEVSNAAFEGAAAHRMEIARLLREAAERVLEGTINGRLYDANGNWVGGFDEDEIVARKES